MGYNIFGFIYNIFNKKIESDNILRDGAHIAVGKLRPLDRNFKLPHENIKDWAQEELVIVCENVHV